MVVKYSPEEVESGLRDLIVFETGSIPIRVRVKPGKEGGYRALVRMRGADVEDRETFEREIRLTLPTGYEPSFTYKEDE